MLLLGVVTSVSLVSCGSDDEETEATASSILGTWKMDVTNSLGSEYILIQFKSDGTYYYQHWGPVVSTGETKLAESYEGTWTLSGSTLTLKPSTGGTSTTKIAMSGSNLVIGSETYYKVN